MANIGDSGDALTRLKDHYGAKERELETRHRDEIQSLRKSHVGEVDKIRADSQKRVQSVQEESSEKLNQKDLQHQKEIEALRGLYAKRLADAKKPT